MTALRHVLLLALPLVLSLSALEAAEPNTLSADEKEQGFVLLFDGEKLDGWKHTGNWSAENGVISRQGRGGSLVYTEAKVPDDFELRFEWKVSEGSNSGVYYRPGQYEYQILDNKRHADGRNPRTSAASLYFCMAPSHDATRPAGEWNTGRIVCKGTVIQHWLNGEKVIDFDYTDPKWNFNINLLQKRGAELAARGANLSLQDHGDPVWYRSICWRELPDDFELERSPVEPAEIPADVLEAERQKLQRILENRRRAAQRRPTN